MVYLPLAHHFSFLNSQFSFLNSQFSDAECAHRQQLNRLRHAIQHLPPRDQTIIRQVYGIGQKKVSQQQIAQQLGITPMTVWRIHEAALKKLKKMLI